MLRLRHLQKHIKRAFDKHPLLANCVTYGTFTTSAEFLQQSVDVYDAKKNGKGLPRVTYVEVK